jgi:HSP20 family protein
MAFFPRYHLSNDSSNSSFHPLFRLLDDFDQYSSGRNGGQTHSRNSSLKSFTPRFDVKELGETYELHGELPGIEQKDVEIEFIDDQTLNIRGRTERSYTSGTPPSIEGAKSSGAITENGEGEHKDKAHQPTVEDAGEDGADNNTENKEQRVTKAQPQKKQEEPQAKFWVSERSVGEFSRSFSFPVRVDQDNVKASMKNGILSIIVPKAKKQESRKITIQ